MRNIGQSDLKVTPICLGGNVFGWTADERQSFEILDAFVDGGGNFIDTADVYANWEPVEQGGISEQIIGRWLKRRGRRDDVIVATKVGDEMAPGQSGLAPDYVAAAVEDSLRRLDLDHVDLLYAHVDDAEVPIAEVLGAFDELVAQGKARAIGASNFTAERLAESLAVSDREGLARYVAIQPEFNLVDRDGYAGELEELCAREALGVMPYYALANGFLTGKYRRDAELPDTPRAEEIEDMYLKDGRGWPVLDTLLAVAERHQAQPAQIALAWLIDRASITAPVASATSVQQVRQLLGALDVALTDEDRDQLDRAGDGAVAS